MALLRLLSLLPSAPERPFDKIDVEQLPGTEPLVQGSVGHTRAAPPATGPRKASPHQRAATGLDEPTPRSVTVSVTVAPCGGGLRSLCDLVPPG